MGNRVSREQRLDPREVPSTLLDTNMFHQFFRTYTPHRATTTFPPPEQLPPNTPTIHQILSLEQQTASNPDFLPVNQPCEVLPPILTQGSIPSLLNTVEDTKYKIQLCIFKEYIFILPCK